MLFQFELSVNKFLTNQPEEYFGLQWKALDFERKIVAVRLDHASVTLTLDTYSRVLPTMQKTATDKLEKMIFGT